MDWLGARLAEHPGMHVYHYAPYEPTALKRLMGFHGTREDAVDRLLREGRLVDLYGVVRQSMRISQPSYSIKLVEAFYGSGAARASARAATRSSCSSVARPGDRALLDAIEAYNEEDCRSTLAGAVAPRTARGGDPAVRADPVGGAARRRGRGGGARRAGRPAAGRRADEWAPGPEAPRLGLARPSSRGAG